MRKPATSLACLLAIVSLLAAYVRSASAPESRPYSRSAPSNVDPAGAVPAEMKFIPGGTAVIGVTEEFIQGLNLEADNEISFMAAAYPERRDVSIDPFYMDTHEVTNEQWKAYLDATNQKPNDVLLAESWKEGTFPKGEGKRPIAFISAKEAEAFARWCLKRLPTEFEWEFAARGPDGKNYPWGEEFDDFDPESKFDRDGKRLTLEQIEANKAKYEGMKIRKGHERANCVESKKLATVDVGSLVDGASPFGIHDLCGNVWEWTSSPFVAYDVKNAEVSIKTTTSKGQKKKYSAAAHFRADNRVLRGGAFNNEKKALFSAFRSGVSPDDQLASIGFRCVRSVVPGVDVLRAAASDLGTFVFRNTPLDWKGVWAQEHVVYDANNLIRGSKHFALATAAQFLKDGKALGRVADLRKESEKGPVYLGVISTSVPIMNPPMPRGVYAIALLSKSENAAKGQKDMTFPKDGWYWAGMAVDSKNAKKKDDKKDKNDKKDEAKEGEDAAPEEKSIHDLDFVAQPGSVPVDRSRDHIVLLDAKTTIVAAIPTAELKEVNPSPMKLDRLMVKEDTIRKIPAHERLTWSFGVQLAGKKVAPFDLSLSFLVGAFDAPPPYVPAVAAEKK